MRKILISRQTRVKISELESYLRDDLNLSKTAARRYSDRMRQFVFSFADETVKYPLCRFKRWCKLGYRCAVFEKHWVFAYEIFPEGIIIRDMSHTAALDDAE